MNLTSHFSLDELAHSEMAVRHGIDNTPPADVLPNLVRLAQLLELVREMLGQALIITSGYRCPAVNRAVGGSSMSAHCEGRAADFIVPAYGTPQVIAKRIARSPLAFDQLIYEGTWCHIAVPKLHEQPRLHILTAHFGSGPATYTAGIPA